MGVPTPPVKESDDKYAACSTLSWAPQGLRKQPAEAGVGSTDPLLSFLPQGQGRLTEHLGRHVMEEQVEST